MHDGNTVVNEAQHVKYISSWEWRSAYILNNRFSLIRGRGKFVWVLQYCHVLVNYIIDSCPQSCPVWPTPNPFAENRTVLTFGGSRHVLVDYNIDSCPQWCPSWPPPPPTPQPFSENRTVLTFWDSGQSPGISLPHPLSNHCWMGYAVGLWKTFSWQFFIGAQMAVSLQETTLIMSGVSFVASYNAYTSTD